MFGEASLKQVAQRDSNTGTTLCLHKVKDETEKGHIRQIGRLKVSEPEWGRRKRAVEEVIKGTRGASFSKDKHMRKDIERRKPL